MGVKYKAVKLTALMPATATRCTTTPSPEQRHREPFRIRCSSARRRPASSPIAKSSDKQFGTYIQDDWAVNDN
jgi:hypothetical protein